MTTDLKKNLIAPAICEAFTEDRLYWVGHGMGVDDIAFFLKVTPGRVRQPSPSRLCEILSQKTDCLVILSGHGIQPAERRHIQARVKATNSNIIAAADALDAIGARVQL